MPRKHKPENIPVVGNVYGYGSSARTVTSIEGNDVCWKNARGRIGYCTINTWHVWLTKQRRAREKEGPDERDILIRELTEQLSIMRELAQTRANSLRVCAVLMKDAVEAGWIPDPDSLPNRAGLNSPTARAARNFRVMQDNINALYKT